MRNPLSPSVEIYRYIRERTDGWTDGQDRQRSMNNGLCGKEQTNNNKIQSKQRQREEGNVT